jgi:hypothetical protein
MTAPYTHPSRKERSSELSFRSECFGLFIARRGNRYRDGTVSVSVACHDIHINGVLVNWC